MPRITLTIRSQKDTTQVLSIQDFKDRFLYGVAIEKDKKPLPDSVYKYWLKFAVEQIEKYLTVKLNLEIITENKNFNHTDWMSWSMIKATYPVVAGLGLDGYIGSVKQVTYPKEWISVKKSSDELHSRLLHIVPNTNSPFHQTAAVYTGLMPNAGWMAGGTRTPNYWTLKYITGFKKIPSDIEGAVGMLAAINILTVGNETMAAAMGILGSSSKSVSIDGLSQSASTYVNGQAGVFGARIKQYTDALLGTNGQEGLLKRLSDYYGAFIWIA